MLPCGPHGPVAVRIITSRQNPVVGRFRAAARGSTPEHPEILLEGARLIVEALDAGLPIVLCAVTPGLLDTDEGARLGARVEQTNGDLLRVPESVLAALSPAATPSGAVAIATRPAWTDEAVFAPDTPLVVLVTDVQDPGNVGAIVRTAEAGGATGVVTTGGTADPFGWKALRGAMGSAFRLPIVGRAEIGAVAEMAHARGASLVATVPRGGAPYSELPLDGPIVLLLGGEGGGLSEAALAMSDLRVTIPMRAPVESLNVAVAAALLVFEARRQRDVRHAGSLTPQPRTP
jgi:RNA methyltransferase, TrmH family